MVRLEEHKHETENKAIERLPLPVKVYIPLSQHIGKPCEPLVKVGDNVLTGQKIATIQAHVFANIHASISGKVVAIQEYPHPVIGRCRAIVIENDGQDQAVNFKAQTANQVKSLSVQEIRNIIQESGIVGMGGASFPAHIKLTPAKPVDTLIVNGAECEPYLTGDNRLMLEKTKEVLLGVGLAAKASGVNKVIIAIEDNKPQAIKAFSGALKGSGYTLKILKSQYPQGGEKQLIKNVLGKEVLQGKLPFDVGVLVHNVATLYAIYEAVYLGKPLYERVVTVTGNCLKGAGNSLVRLGTPVSELIERCKPFLKEPKKVVFGGPMMGVAQFDMNVPVIKSTNGVVFLSQETTSEPEDEPCIRCGRCVRECPSGLMPCLITLASQREKWELAKGYNCLDCIECGCCSFLCPQKINLVQYIRLAKMRAPK